MAFFDRVRKEKSASQNFHPAWNEIKRIFNEEGIQLGDEIIAKMCSGFPKTQLLQCTGGCEPMLIFVGEPSTLTCQQCGRLMKPVPVNFPEGSLSGELREEIAGVGHFYYALTKMRTADLDAAIASFTKAIRFKPEYVDAYYNRSEARIGKRDFRGAIEDCNKVIQLVPSDADAYINRGSAKAQLRDFSGCLSDTDRALVLGYKKPIAHFNRGFCLLNLGRPQEARKALEQFIALAPTDPRAQSARAMINLHT